MEGGPIGAFGQIVLALVQGPGPDTGNLRTAFEKNIINGSILGGIQHEMFYCFFCQFRHCTNPPPSNGGMDCPGLYMWGESCDGGNCANTG